MMTQNTEDIQRVQRFYDEKVQAEWARLEQNVMEYAISSHLLRLHLPSPPAVIFDIGGGPGRYSLDLAQQGYAVHLLDLSPENITFARNKAREIGTTLAETRIFDASTPFPYPEASVDAVLMMGPLYHLIDPKDRQKAIREAHRILKPGGLIFTAFCTMFGALQAVLMFNTQGLEEEWSTMQYGVNNYKLGFTTAWFARPEEIEELMSDFTRIEMVNCEGFSNNNQQQYQEIPPALFQQYLQLNLEFARAPGTIGAGNHILFVGKK